MNKKYVFIPLYRSFGFRYLQATEVIKKLSKNYKVILFVDFKKKNFFEDFFRDYDVILEDLKVDNLNFTNFPKFRNFVFFIKKFFNGKEKEYYNNCHNLWKIKFKDEMKSKKIVFLTNFCALLLNNSKFLRKLFFFLENRFDRKKFLTEYFDKYSPVLLITTSYGYDYDQFFIREAKNKKCKTVSIIYSWDNPTSKGYKSSNSDLYLVWNENMKKELIVFHDIEEKKIKISGIAHWDIFHQDIKNKNQIKNKFFKENNFNKDDKILLFFSSSPRDFNNAYEKIEKLCKIFIDNKNIKIIARMHPLYMNKKLCKKYCGKSNDFFEERLTTKYQGTLIFKNPKIIEYGDKMDEVIYPIDDINNLKKLYSSASILLNEYSTTLLEGIIYDLPIINVAIGNYRNTNLPIKIYSYHHHLKRLENYKAVFECENYDSLESKIKEILNGNDKSKLNRKKLFDQELSNFKGEASEKIVQEIFKFEAI